MGKRILITDELTGNIDFDEHVDGGYSVQYAKHTDEGWIHSSGTINNGKYDHAHWIKNDVYGPIADRLMEKFEELKHIKGNRILFLEDTEYKGKGTGPKWVARVKKAGKELSNIWGYRYVIETREFFVERMSRNQLVALLYHELRHIGFGEILPHEIEDWTNMVDYLGRDWANTETHGDIADILGADFEWAPQRQLTLLEYKKQVTG